MNRYKGDGAAVGRPSVAQTKALIDQARRLVVEGGDEKDRAAFQARKAAFLARLDIDAAAADVEDTGGGDAA